MNIEHYTPVQLSKRRMHVSQFFSTHFEPFLLSLLVLTGIIGSIYLFGQKIFVGDTALISDNSSPAPASVASFLISKEDEASSNEFDEYIELKGKIEAGKTFYFTFLKDNKASRYVMDMGDGVRLIVTQKELRYEYAMPGKYVIELKEIKNGLLQIIGTKKVKVK